MSDISSRLYSILSGLGVPVSPLVAGSNYETPFIVYTRISSDPQNSFNGLNQLMGATYQIDCYHSTYALVNTLALSVKNILGGKNATLLNQFHNQEGAGDNLTGQTLYRVTLNYKLWFYEF